MPPLRQVRRAGAQVGPDPSALGSYGTRAEACPAPVCKWLPLGCLRHDGLMSGRGMKWVGAMLYAALLIGVALYLFSLDGLEEADQASSVIGACAALLGVPTVVVAVVQLWRRQRSTSSLDEAAGQLAVAVKNQWDGEAALRGVNDPYPLPVAWCAADE